METRRLKIATHKHRVPIVRIGRKNIVLAMLYDADRDEKNKTLALKIGHGGNGLRKGTAIFAVIFSCFSGQCGKVEMYGGNGRRSRR